MDSGSVPLNESPAVQALRATLAETKANGGPEFLLRTPIGEGLIEALEDAIARQVAAEQRTTNLRKALEEVEAAGDADPGLLRKLIEDALDEDNAASGKGTAA